MRLSVRQLMRIYQGASLMLERRRFGYRRIWQLLRREGFHVNHKRASRLYRLSGLGVKRRRRRKGLTTVRLPLLRPVAPNLTWSMDLGMDTLATSLTCVDDFTKEVSVNGAPY
ncbi:ORF2 ISSen4 [Klebsiella pneumoniae]|uniref:HTH-like domain-containing protein n=1 Tax=Klebsiella pneumoniae TaxID=573 RepID=A0A8A6WLA4_KLEPN|nr:hypothetical protein HGCKNKHA_04934 [Klebsiella pneumoniae]SAU89341.1 ORF2 ISSen4 [Klebsiella pneumoniae]SBY93098.1 ORF2 ISSen4 [Klebsiella pneumoniae]SSM98993.1 ORF2 ISSen4 [Klebsiella pneumoniae]SVW35081.1 ORF2 ISSen4 [Klebsiella pneumoniae]